MTFNIPIIWVFSSRDREWVDHVNEKPGSEVDFNLPCVDINNSDSKELRQKILKLTVHEAQKIGINKSTLWYLKKRAKLQKPLKFYKKIMKNIIVNK